MANVTVIPATKTMFSASPLETRKKRTVAAYARVSTDNDEQISSYEAQVDYYTKLIQSNPLWEFVGVYADEGISGLNTKNRDGFRKMIADAVDGKIDLILTKSISRFARNTVDTLTAVRKLKEVGCEVSFEKENIQTFDSKGELLITIMSSLAQEESRSISENVTWGKRKAFQDGKSSWAYGSMLGFRKGKDEQVEIVPEEAEIVRMMYKWFISGKTVHWIASELTAKGIPTPMGKTKWQAKVVESILTNEKYKGAALLQKSFTVDFITKTKKKNEGEIQQYYVSENHEAIIEPDEWEAVQIEMAKRKARPGKCNHNSLHPFSTKIICGDCGSFYGSKVWHSNIPERRRIVWQCNSKYSNEHKCTTTHLYEEDIRRLFMRAINKVAGNIDSLADDCDTIRNYFLDTAEIDSGISALSIEVETITAMTERLIADNATAAISQNEYARKYNDYSASYEKAKAELEALERKRLRQLSKADSVKRFKEMMIQTGSTPTEYSDDLWNVAVESATVWADETITFKFKNGQEITEKIYIR